MTKRRLQLGADGEALAAAWYVAHGYAVLGRNWRCREGEIDLIVHRERSVVICEVKTRATDAFGVPAEAVTRRSAANSDSSHPGGSPRRRSGHERSGSTWRRSWRASSRSSRPRSSARAEDCVAVVVFLVNLVVGAPISLGELGAAGQRRSAKKWVSARFSTSARSHWRKWPAPGTTNGPMHSVNATEHLAGKLRQTTWSSGP